MTADQLAADMKAAEQQESASVPQPRAAEAAPQKAPTS
jgi:hypothetical protein